MPGDTRVKDIHKPKFPIQQGEVDQINENDQGSEPIGDARHLKVKAPSRAEYDPCIPRRINPCLAN